VAEKVFPMHAAERQPVRLPLPDNRVDIFTFALDRSCAYVRYAEDCLDESEKTQVRSFATKTLSRRYVVAHSLVRHVLGRYLGCSPRHIVFTRNEHGKPFAHMGGRASSPVNFNLSHSDELAAIAIARDPRVGIDIECHREINDALALAKEIFTPDEQTMLAAMSPPHQRNEFFRLWARKEAVIKGLGTGLFGNASSIDVRPHAVDLAPLEYRYRSSVQLTTMFVTDLTLDRPCSLAVATSVANADISLVTRCESPAILLGITNDAVGPE
jgi:4'-phosphopantetheinyl transferase